MLGFREVTKKYPEANFLQSPEYGRMNELLGCKVITSDFGGIGYALMIVRDAKRGRYLEIPCGPLIDWGDTEVVKVALSQIAEVAEKEKCVFVRIRPQLPATPENLQLLEKYGFKKSPMHLAAEHTVMIDLTKTEETLLSEMRRQTRYEVRRAEKMGIEVNWANSEEDFQEFHQVQAETAKRQNFVPPSLKTLMAEREAFGENIRIYKAEIAAEKVENGSKNPENDKENTTIEAPLVLPTNRGNKLPIAYGLIIKSGKEADYYEAASTLLNRKLPGAYSLLWQAIKDMKSEEIERFNLWGIAPAGQPHHRYAGVTTFKTGFGGEIVEFVPAHDLVISKIKYLKNLTVETVRKKRRHL